MTILELEAVAEWAGPSGAATPGQLAVAARRSEPGAWDALVRRYGRMVTSIARNQGLSDQDAADVSQTVWLRLLEHLDRIRDPERIGGWLSKTARHEAIRLGRQRQRTAPVENLDALELVDDSCDRLSGVEAEERDSGVRAALTTLPSRQQALLELLMSDPQPSYVEVSAHLGIPVGSIGPSRQRSLQALRSKCVAAHV